ncbi:PREDICTED: E3 ubiquitin-protein ligase TTC3-like [Priapulus caudatus]|uniref:E3 ubiquitin-protein ligase TTC3-like n=1 Tax=Priapulus caudatus TaxID=37621 RepID=A0ABM1EHA6_PRICU|nr:PREDICTED: E3 ubiquitin-protein ligase TTC3-like [Priapulus caudatus]
MALKPLMRGLQADLSLITARHWPGTREAIIETQPGNLKMYLESLVENCKHPPAADAVCRYADCLQVTMEIYFSDLDFEGFLRIGCIDACKLEYHPGCWKELRAEHRQQHSEKDFLGAGCLTPDCAGVISSVVMYGSDGAVRREYRDTTRQRSASPHCMRRSLKMQPR